MSSGLFAAPFFVAALLLVVSGGLKVRDPGPPSRALQGAGLPGGRSSVRLLGVAEVAVGSWSIVSPHPWAAAALALVYAAFAGFLLRLRARQPDASCGCAGRGDLPPTILHALLDLVAAASGVAVALTSVPGLTAILRSSPGLAPPLVLGLGAAAFLAASVVRLVPSAFGAYQGQRSGRGGMPRPFSVSRGSLP